MVLGKDWLDLFLATKSSNIPREAEEMKKERETTSVYKGQTLKWCCNELQPAPAAVISSVKNDFT